MFHLIRCLLLLSLVVVCQAQIPCPCSFDVRDEQGCAVYGTLDGDLLPWEVAKPSCLNALSIDSALLETLLMFAICNNAEGTGLYDNNVQEFLNFIRPPADSDLAKEIALRFPQFFQENPETGEVEFVPEIAGRSGNLYPCATQESFCWNEIKIYFTERTDEIQQVCLDTLWPQQINSLISEQSEARVAVCEAGSDAPNACEPLKSQIVELDVEDCSEVGVVASRALFPDEETCNAEATNGNDGSGASTTTSSVLVLLLTLMLSLCQLYLV